MATGLTLLQNTDVPVPPHDHLVNRSDSNLSLSDGLFLTDYRHVRHLFLILRSLWLMSSKP
jgi:hypothetical protein